MRWSIDLNKPQNGLVTLYVGRQPWFTGEMGRYKKNVAVRIQDRIYQKKDEDENTNQTEAADGEEYVRLRQMEFEEPGVSQ